MKKKNMKVKNPYIVGDMVRIKDDLRDAYGEIWHHKDSIQKVRYISEDGEGIMFSSDLGIHFSKVELVKGAKRCRCCGQVLTDKE